MKTEEDSFKVVSEVKDQRFSVQGTNQCGVLAVAFATELAFSGKVTYVNFLLNQLRPHLLKCIRADKFQPFPRAPEPVKPAKRLGGPLPVQVHCYCRLPGTFGTMVLCASCRRYYHIKCMGLTREPTARRWLCTSLTK